MSALFDRKVLLNDNVDRGFADTAGNLELFSDESIGENLERDRRRSDFMPPNMYKALTAGDADFFREAAEDTEAFFWEKVSPRENTILHVATNSGHEELVKLILDRFPELVEKKNSDGDLPLHVAAASAPLSVVKLLIRTIQALQVAVPASASASQQQYETLLRKGNKEQNTALHVALKNRREEVARVLFVADPQVFFVLNREKKSPLYLAAEAGYLQLVKAMMEISDSFFKSLQREGKSIVHAAIAGKNKEVLGTILSKQPSLISLIDSNGMTPLAYATSTGYVEGVRYILDNFVAQTYERDLKGFFPIHVASKRGHVLIIQEFLQRCPDSRELLDLLGRNILHTAAMTGKARAVRFMLKVPELGMLINERDWEGNTPLHLATKEGHPKIVSMLTWDARVRLELENSKGFTALDVAEHVRAMPSFRQRLTWQALRHANAPGARHTSDGKRKLQSLDYHQEAVAKDRVNTLLLVATLLVIITFAAGFTVPGGYNNSGEDQGMATLVKQNAFRAFMVCNAIAMYSSILVAVALIWAQLGDRDLVNRALKFALPLLGLALAMISMEFMAGVFAVVSSLHSLANFILFVGLVSLLFLLALFLPLYLPSSLDHRYPLLRRIFYYPFCFLIILTTTTTTTTGYD